MHAMWTCPCTGESESDSESKCMHVIHVICNMQYVGGYMLTEILFTQ